MACGPAPASRPPARQLKVGTPIRWGLNTSYVIPGASSNGVHHGVIREIGIANRQLTNTRAAALRLLSSF